MQKEIKFRAKIKTDNGYADGHYKPDWVYGYLFKTPLTSENFEADSFQSGKNRWCIATEEGVVYEIDPETVGQFTGLCDKNNKEIYFGDRVKLINKAEEHGDSMQGTGIVGWCNDDLRFGWIEFKEQFEDNNCFHILTWLGTESVEVIGDIYEK